MASWNYLLDPSIPKALADASELPSVYHYADELGDGTRFHLLYGRRDKTHRVLGAIVDGEFYPRTEMNSPMSHNKKLCEDVFVLLGTLYGDVRRLVQEPELPIPFFEITDLIGKAQHNYVSIEAEIYWATFLYTLETYGLLENLVPEKR